MAQPSAATAIPSRDQLNPKDCWNLEAVYPTPDAWEAEFGRIDALLAPVEALKDKLASPETLARLFKAEDDLALLIDRLHTFAHHREDEDTANPTNQARSQRILARYAEVGARTAWIEPEILARPLETLEAWRDAPALAPYRRTMSQLIRRKPHVLSKEEETLLSLASEVFHTPQSAFSYLTNADMKFPDVADENGVARPLSNGRFITFLENRDRDVRRRAFESLYDTYIQFQNTLASTLAGKVKLDNMIAKVRRFGSALEASLHPDNVPVAIYDALIAAVHEALPAFHEYVTLRRDLLGVAPLDMYDLYVPIVPDFDMKVSWDEACEWVRESCRPMGDAYMKGVDEALASRWIDVYENRGKRSGAYSGGCYGSPSFILMNYQGTLDHVFTLAHELGHSMHSWLANRAQPYRYAQYTIFVAEIASTTNEALLLNYLLKRADDPKLRAYLLNHLCDQFRGTVYRQTMFAEFERMLHEMDSRGEPLTAQAISAAYSELNAAFQGPSVKPDARIANEWSRIPHFYYNFYVYKYATGFCAAQVFAQRILAGVASRDLYLDMLRSGGSADPLDLVGRAGVDLTSPAVLKDAFASFQSAVVELRALIAKR